MMPNTTTSRPRSLHADIRQILAEFEERLSERVAAMETRIVTRLESTSYGATVGLMIAFFG